MSWCLGVFVCSCVRVSLRLCVSVASDYTLLPLLLLFSACRPPPPLLLRCKGAAATGQESRRRAAPGTRLPVVPQAQEQSRANWPQMLIGFGRRLNRALWNGAGEALEQRR